MRIKWLFFIVAAAQLSVWAFMIGKDYDTGYTEFYLLEAATVINIILLVILYRQIIRPLNTLSDGLNLLKAQDWNTRLRPVGQPEVDRITEVLNMMLEKLKNQRIRFEEQNHFLNILIERAPVGVIITGNDNRVKMVNPAAASLLSLDVDVSGKTAGQIAACRNLMNIPLGETVTFRTENFHTLRCTHLDFIDCGVSHDFYIIDDISDSIAAAEKETYGKVIRYISHEVNNTVAGLSSAFDILASYFESADDDIPMLIDACASRAKTLGDFIARYADVVKLSQPERGPVAIDCFIDSLGPFLKRIAATSDSCYEFTAGCGDAEVLLDAAMFERVIINIVKNASESIASATTKGIIKISTHYKSNNLIELCICDNGAGISDDVRQLLFTPFFTNKPDGHGIGLTFISEVLRKHGFRFSLRTDSDRLTRFSIELPVYQGSSL